MSKLYKIFYIALLALLWCFPVSAVEGSPASPPDALDHPEIVRSGVCDLCCLKPDCGGDLKCVNAAAGSGCDLDKEEGVGTCQDENKVMLCSLSTHTDLEELINEIMKWLLIFSLTLAPLMILLGGFYMLTSAGEPRRAMQGKTIITWAVIGLAVILFAKAFTSIITSILK